MNRWLGCETLGQSIIILLDWRSSFWEPAPTWNGHVFPRNPVVENWVSLHCCNPITACSFTCIHTNSQCIIFGRIMQYLRHSTSPPTRGRKGAFKEGSIHVTAPLSQSERSYTESHMANDPGMWEKGPATLFQHTDTKITTPSMALLTHFNTVLIKAHYSKKNLTCMSSSL